MICFLVSSPKTFNQSAVYYLIWQVSLNNLEKQPYFENFFFQDFIKISFWDKPFSWASTCALAEPFTIFYKQTTSQEQLTLLWAFYPLFDSTSLILNKKLHKK